MRVNTTLILTKELMDSLESYSKKHNISKKDAITQSLEDFLLIKKAALKVIPKKLPERVSILFNSDKDFLEKLKMIALKQGVSLSELVRQVLDTTLN